MRTLTRTMRFFTQAIIPHLNDRQQLVQPSHFALAESQESIRLWA
jgi:hypothetical protein